jgi:hypothetical protein
MESADHGAEDHGAEAGNHTHRQGAETHRPSCGGPRLRGTLRIASPLSLRKSAMVLILV